MAWSEKQPLLRVLVVGKPQVKIPLLAILSVLIMLALGTLFTNVDTVSTGKGLAVDVEEGVTRPWSWFDIESSKDLEWQSCYEGKYECARLDVPMDWQEPSDDLRVVLAVIKLPAKTDDNRQPPIFINPGGPGGSGVSAIQSFGEMVQIVAGVNHDIISFDPRGVGVSTPRVECWGNSQKRHLWSVQQTQVIDEHPGLIYNQWAQAIAFSKTCEQSMNETKLLEHISTAYAARDMLAILKGTGHEKLRYWGFSYGTILGGVFAGMFPKRVERLVSDGNVDYSDWFNLDHTDFISDADLIFDAFDKACHKAGPVRCALWAESASAVQDRRAGVLESLKLRPVLIPADATDSGPSMPELVTYSKLQLLTRSWAYAPLADAEGIASVYASLEQGDGLPYYKSALARKLYQTAESYLCPIADEPTGIAPDMTADAFSAIMCSDGEPLSDDVSELEDWAAKLTNTSIWTGAASAHFKVACAGRTVRPKWRFTVDDFKGDTHHPILYIGNMADNVTPLASSKKNSAHFPSSVVLRQNSYGHCSPAAPSTCTARHVRAYFQEGKLPDAGTECEPDFDLFELPPKNAMVVQEMDELSAAVLEMSRNIDFSHIHPF